jgi:hypothetical protein
MLGRGPRPSPPLPPPAPRRERGAPPVRGHASRREGLAHPERAAVERSRPERSPGPGPRLRPLAPCARTRRLGAEGRGRSAFRQPRRWRGGLACSRGGAPGVRPQATDRAEAMVAGLQRAPGLPPHRGGRGAPWPRARLFTAEPPTRRQCSGRGRAEHCAPSWLERLGCPGQCSAEPLAMVCRGMRGPASGLRVGQIGQRVGALRGPEEPLQGASEAGALGAVGQELSKSLRRGFQGPGGRGHRSTVTQRGPRSDCGVGMLRTLTPEALAHVNTLLVDITQQRHFIRPFRSGGYGLLLVHFQ